MTTHHSRHLRLHLRSCYQWSLCLAAGKMVLLIFPPHPLDYLRGRLAWG